MLRADSNKLRFSTLRTWTVCGLAGWLAVGAVGHWALAAREGDVGSDAHAQFVSVTSRRLEASIEEHGTTDTWITAEKLTPILRDLRLGEDRVIGVRKIEPDGSEVSLGDWAHGSRQFGIELDAKAGVLPARWDVAYTEAEPVNPTRHSALWPWLWISVGAGMVFTWTSAQGLKRRLQRVANWIEQTESGSEALDLTIARPRGSDEFAWIERRLTSLWVLGNEPSLGLKRPTSADNVSKWDDGLLPVSGLSGASQSAANQQPAANDGGVEKGHAAQSGDLDVA